MRFLTLATLIALPVSVAFSGAAHAWADNPHMHPWDKGCDKVNCYAPVTAYVTGHYSVIKCKDPHKYFTHKDGVYQCVAHKKVAK